MSEYKTDVEHFDILWSEERARAILDRKWEELLESMLCLSVDMKETLEVLDSLEGTSSRRNYVKGLPDELVEALLVKIMREMRNEKIQFSGTHKASHGYH